MEVSEMPYLLELNTAEGRWPAPTPKVVFTDDFGGTKEEEANWNSNVLTRGVLLIPPSSSCTAFQIFTFGGFFLF